MMPFAPMGQIGGSSHIPGEVPYRPASRIALLPHEGCPKVGPPGARPASEASRPVKQCPRWAA